MNAFRIALANIRFPATPSESVELSKQAIAQAASERAELICFPECYVPGYRAPGKVLPPPDPAFLERAWTDIAAAAAKADIAVILGTERVVDHALLISALVINRDGTPAGFQDKVQLDPSEEGTYSFGSERRVFQSGPLIFGIVICHEGWRYPETVRWAARHGAKIVFHPHLHEAEPGGYAPNNFRRSREHLSRKGNPVPRGGEHLLFRQRECRKRRLANDFSGRATRRDVALLPAVWQGGPAHRGHRLGCSHRPPRSALQSGIIAISPLSGRPPHARKVSS